MKRKYDLAEKIYQAVKSGNFYCGTGIGYIFSILRRKIENDKNKSCRSRWEIKIVWNSWVGEFRRFRGFGLPNDSEGIFSSWERDKRGKEVLPEHDN